MDFEEDAAVAAARLEGGRLRLERVRGGLQVSHQARVGDGADHQPSLARVVRAKGVALGVRPGRAGRCRRAGIGAGGRRGRGRGRRARDGRPTRGGARGQRPQTMRADSTTRVGDARRRARRRARRATGHGGGAAHARVAATIATRCIVAEGDARSDRAAASAPRDILYPPARRRPASTFRLVHRAHERNFRDVTENVRLRSVTTDGTDTPEPRGRVVVQPRRPRQTSSAR